MKKGPLFLFIIIFTLLFSCSEKLGNVDAVSIEKIESASGESDQTSLLEDSQAAGFILPVQIISGDTTLNHSNDSEIVILSLVGSYDPSKQSENGPNDNTPAQMLEKYLSSTRDLGLTGNTARIPGIDYASKIKTYIVEGGEEDWNQPTRDKASQICDHLGISGYENDMSIPVLFVFKKGSCIGVFSYNSSPGRKGETLRDLVVDQLF